MGLPVRVSDRHMVSGYQPITSRRLVDRGEVGVDQHPLAVHLHVDAGGLGLGGLHVELRIPVWQFVRIMVELEGRASSKRPRGGSVYTDWRDAWAELDARLSDLGERDAAAFANLMMEQEVVVTCRPQARVSELREDE